MTAHGFVPVLATGTLRASSRSRSMAMGLPVGLTAVSIVLACALPF
ncbi:hypothetical protein [Arthrobacter sp. UM1]|nr:hypothetical protein [Arthrobacter sp. UM1]MCB4208033.1 hypothetical protein [Arthrobacter sp. UM1]